MEMIMATADTTVSDMLVTVKSREIQRGLLAQMRRDNGTARKHLLAAAHLEMVLAEDYHRAGLEELALRSRISAASCFWRVGEVKQAKDLFKAIRREEPDQADNIQQIIKELRQ
jgi:hypothetical protein